MLVSSFLNFVLLLSPLALVSASPKGAVRQVRRLQKEAKTEDFQVFEPAELEARPSQYYDVALPSFTVNYEGESPLADLGLADLLLNVTMDTFPDIQNIFLTPVGPEDEEGVRYYEAVARFLSPIDSPPDGLGIQTLVTALLIGPDILDIETDDGVEFDSIQLGIPQFTDPPTEPPIPVVSIPIITNPAAGTEAPAAPVITFPIAVETAAPVDTVPVVPVVPVEEPPVVETPVVETPVVETPVVETPVVETPVETPLVETPVVEAPVDTPVVEAPVEEPADEPAGLLPVTGPTSIELPAFALQFVGTPQGNPDYPDLGLSSYVQSEIDGVDSATLSITSYDPDTNTVYFEGAATINTDEATVQNEYAALLTDVEYLNEYWANNPNLGSLEAAGPAAGDFIVTAPVAPAEPVDLETEVTIFPFTLDFDVAGQIPMDLGLNTYLTETVSSVHPGLQSLAVNLLAVDEAALTVEYDGAATFAEPGVVEEDVRTLIYNTLQDTDALNAYYASDPVLYPGLVINSFTTDYVPSGPDFDLTDAVDQYDVVLADFTVYIEGEGSSETEDLGLPDYLEDEIRKNMTEILDVQFTARTEGDNAVVYENGVAVFLLVPGQDQRTSPEVIPLQMEILENTDSVNAYWAADPETDLRVENIEVSQYSYAALGGVEPWIIGTTVAVIVVACFLVLFFMPRA